MEVLKDFKTIKFYKKDTKITNADRIMCAVALPVSSTHSDRDTPSQYSESAKHC